MWVNVARRFVRGAESLQLQGGHAATWCPGHQNENNALLQRVAGNMYSIPLIGWYLLLAMLTVLPRHSAASVAAAPIDLLPQSIARVLLHVFLDALPVAFTGLQPGGVVVMSSLCSGAAFAHDFVEVLVAEIARLPVSPNVQTINKFACEADNDCGGLEAARRQLPGTAVP